MAAAVLSGLALSASVEAHDIKNVTDLASTETGSLNLPYEGTEKAVAFTTGSAISTVASVQLELGAYSGGGHYYVYLYSNSGNAPGSDILDFSDSAQSGDVTFTPTAETELAADTTYWLVLEGIVTINGTGSWEYTTGTPTTSSPDDWTITEGYDAIPYPYTGAWVSKSVTETPLFSIETTPEPGTLALAGFGAAAFWRLRRRANACAPV